MEKKTFINKGIRLSGAIAAILAFILTGVQLRDFWLGQIKNFEGSVSASGVDSSDFVEFLSKNIGQVVELNIILDASLSIALNYIFDSSNKSFVSHSDVRVGDLGGKYFAVMTDNGCEASVSRILDLNKPIPDRLRDCVSDTLIKFELERSHTQPSYGGTGIVQFYISGPFRVGVSYGSQHVRYILYDQ